MRPEFPLNGLAIMLSLPNSPAKESYSVLHFMVLLTKHFPCLLVPFRKQSKQRVSCVAIKSDEPSNSATTSGSSSRIENISSGRKIKASSTWSYLSAAGNKVMHFTAYDPNTCCAKLAFCHLNWRKMCLGWHFIFTICPYCKIKAVPFSFLGISLWLNSSLNARLC